MSHFLCLAVAWPQVDAAGASEFIAGKLTGLALEMAEHGMVFIPLAVILTLFCRRIATAMAFLASLLCMPLYLYVLATGPYPRVFLGQYWSPTGSTLRVEHVGRRRRPLSRSSPPL